VTIVPYCQTERQGRIACAQSGCGDCMNALLRENVGLIWAVIRAQRKGLADYTDLMQEGRIGFWLAVKHFDPGRGVRLSTFAWHIIRRRIWGAVQRVSKEHGYLAAESEDIGLRGVEEWQAEQTRAALAESLACLSAQQREVIALHAGWNGAEPLTFAEIGKRWGVSRQRAHQVHSEGILLLRVPGISLRLRSLYEFHSRANYRLALGKNWEQQRRQRRRK